MAGNGGSLMLRELQETPAAVRRLFAVSGARLREAGRRLRALDPPVVVTTARGSSDNAATFFKYACEILTGRPVASLGPSVASVYGARLRLSGAAMLAISQSGRSPDLLAAIRASREGGAATLAIVNDESSPLAEAADVAIPLRAGPERSVAATKTCIASAAAALAILGEWTADAELAAALRDLPDRLDEALAADWTDAAEPLGRAASLYVLGRGPAYAVALEAALKFKETAGLHAEAFSGAEIMHGPVSLVEAGFPVLAFLPDDAARAGMTGTVEALVAKGATVFAASAGPCAGRRLPAATGHPLVQALAMQLAFYRLVEAVARGRGRDPDAPPNLRKVTHTL
jgi:glucosamine--fructose-6-phosphate aminotransferase (isomerizing)